MKWHGRFDQRWEKCFAEAECYYHEHGNLNVPTNYVQNGFRLDRWLHRQRNEAKAGRLSSDKLKQLDRIGFTTITRNKSWDEKYNMARMYYDEHGNLEIPFDYRLDNGVWLGKWLTVQRQNRRNGKLSQEQIHKLNAIGMYWEDVWQNRWENQLDTVGAYPRNAAGVPIVPADAVSEYGTKLKQWVELQERKYRRGQLLPTQRVKWERMLCGEHT